MKQHFDKMMRERNAIVTEFKLDQEWQFASPALWNLHVNNKSYVWGW